MRFQSRVTTEETIRLAANTVTKSTGSYSLHMNRLPFDSIPFDVAFRRLQAAGWTFGDVAVGPTWFVTGNNGENVIHASADNQAEAWRIATEQAAAVGMLLAE